MNPKLDKKNAMLAGVCAGLAKYYKKDLFLIRLLAILLVVVTGFVPGIIAYVVLAVLMD